MPIKIATVGRQRTVATLAKALFDVGDRPELQARAEEMLMRANPALREAGALKAGATVVVPDAPDLRVTDKVQRAGLGVALPRELAASRSEARIAAARKLVESAGADAQAQRARLRDRAFTAAFASAHPGLRDDLRAISEAADAESEKLVRRAELLLDALQRIDEDQKRRDARRGG